MTPIKWDVRQFHYVIDLPEEVEVRDLTTGVYEPSKSEYDIGRYDENRPGFTIPNYLRELGRCMLA